MIIDATSTDATSTRAMRHAEESSCARCVVPSQRLQFTIVSRSRSLPGVRGFGASRSRKDHRLHVINRRRVSCTAQRGSGTVLLASMALGVVVAVWGAMIISGWYSTSRLAHHSADIAALAAAQAREKGIEPCSVARKAAQANEATLSSCTVDASSVDYVVTVSVTAQLRPMLHIPRAPRTITVTSLAGPQK